MAKTAAPAPGTCQAILESGARKGEACGVKAKEGSCYCGRHVGCAAVMAAAAGATSAPPSRTSSAKATAAAATATVKIGTCQAILESGARKGEVCGVKAKEGSCYCGTHLKSAAAATVAAAPATPSKPSTAKAAAATKSTSGPALCQATKKDGNPCTNPAKVGNRCGVHKL